MIVNCKSLLSPYIKREGLVQNYLNDIRKYEVLSKEEEKELLKKVHSPDPKIRQNAIDTLINHNQRFVTSVAMKYTNGEDVLDLVNQGNLGLIEAIKRFDINNSKDVRLITYAVWWIQKSINEYIISYTDIVTPANVIKLRALTKKIKNRFLNVERRTPTLEEIRTVLQEEYGINVKNLYDLENYQCISIDAKTESEDPDETFGENALFNAYTATDNVSDDVNTRDKKEVVKSLLNYLTERERTILIRSFGLNDNGVGDTHYTIGVDLGLTKERVRQIEKEAISKLNTIIKENKISNI